MLPWLFLLWQSFPRCDSTVYVRQAVACRPTIGDAYLGIAGLPGNEERDCCLDMIRFAQSYAEFRAALPFPPAPLLHSFPHPHYAFYLQNVLDV